MKKSEDNMPAELQPVVRSGRRRQQAPAPPQPPSRNRRQHKHSGEQPRRATPRWWRRTYRTALWGLTILAALGMIAASYGGNIPPASLKGICLMVLSFPAWLTAIALMTVIDALWCRKALIVCALVYVSCASAIWDFFPLNVFNASMKRYASVPRFSLLTYNVSNMSDLTGKYPGNVNPTAAYILKVNADIVNLQECYPMAASSKRHFTQAQLDSLHAAYPYMITSGQTLTLLSKYPAEALHIPTDHTAKPKYRGDRDKIAAFRIRIQGTNVTLFNVHLESYGLTRADKNLYHQLTDLEDPDRRLRAMLKDVKSTLLSKVQVAAVLRQRQTERLVKLIDHFGGPNVIVAGDFNDVPGCYALRRLADCNMRQVYPEVCFGPAITFHADRFYFRIDHVLWRGNLKPLRMWKGSPPYSDHYPLIAVFALTGDRADKQK